MFWISSLAKVVNVLPEKKESNRADWNISNSWLCVQLGEQAGDMSWTQQQIPPTPGHTCPAPGLSGQQIFCFVILAVVVRRGRA